MENLVNYKEIENAIIELRGLRVILDADVARLYGVETKRINEAVRNNPDKFPDGYVCLLIRPKQRICGRNFRPQIFLRNRGYYLRLLQRRGYICLPQF